MRNDVTVVNFFFYFTRLELQTFIWGYLNFIAISGNITRNVGEILINIPVQNLTLYGFIYFLIKDSSVLVSLLQGFESFLCRQNK